jgi:hypothetical protein
MFFVRLFLILFLSNSSAYAQAIPQQTAVRIIVAEAADQGLKGMICVGEVLRRRASTKGFYGYASNRLKLQSRSIRDTAAIAWKLSAHTDYTNGADHFENIHRFGIPWWAKYCVKTYEYKDHVFFKEIHSS